MNHLKLLLCILYAVCITVCLPVCANGDPVLTSSSLLRSANPTPRPIADIQVVKEDLKIKPGKYTTVQVKYVLWNRSDKDYIDIDYGFPVDYRGGGEGHITADFYSESSFAIGWFDDYIRNISFFADGYSLEFHTSEEVRVTDYPLSVSNEEDRYRDEYEEEGDEFYKKVSDIYRRWFYTSFSIKAGETLTLEINYSLRNGSSEPLPYYQDQVRRRSGYLLYDLTPAMHWGDGTAREITIEIDIRDIEDGGNTDLYTDPKYSGYYGFGKYMHLEETTDFPGKEDVNDLLVESLISGRMIPGSYGVYGYTFRKQGDKLIYEERDFDFSQSFPLIFDYSWKEKILHWTLEDYLPHRIPSHLYSITATEEQAAYPIDHLTDLNFSTAWVSSREGGVGQKLVIEFHEPTDLSTVMILGGYYKNATTYTQNNRPALLQLDMEAWDAGWNNEWKETVELAMEDLPYVPVSLSDVPTRNFYMWRRGYYSRLLFKRIEITVKKVYPGSKYNDLCISEILLLNSK